MDADETGLSDWRINLIGQSGKISRTDITKEDGSYSFENLDPNTYTLEEITKKGWSPTVPQDGSYLITLINSSISDKDLGNKQNSYTISGMIFDDQDRNGFKNGNDLGLPSWKAYIDSNNNGKWDSEEPIETTDKDGAYAFQVLNPGIYVIREEKKDGWLQTGQMNYTVTIEKDHYMEDHKDFGNTAGTFSISGVQFNDLNGNGIKDENEPRLPGWIVSLTNANGSKVNATTDLDGSYKFANLIPGSYSISEIPCQGWRQTLPDSGSYLVPLMDTDVVGKDFGIMETPAPKLINHTSVDEFKNEIINKKINYDAISKGVNTAETGSVPNFL